MQRRRRRRHRRSWKSETSVTRYYKQNAAQAFNEVQSVLNVFANLTTSIALFSGTIMAQNMAQITLKSGPIGFKCPPIWSHCTLERNRVGQTCWSPVRLAGLGRGPQRSNFSKFEQKCLIL